MNSNPSDIPGLTGPTTAPAAAPDERPRLLVVDDQRANIQALFQAFQADHKVLMATSGEQALAMCRSQPPDLVLLDVVIRAWTASRSASA